MDMFWKKAFSFNVRSTVRNNLKNLAELGVAYEAHPATHIEIRVGECNAEDDPKDKQDLEVFLAGALRCLDARRYWWFQMKIRAGTDKPQRSMRIKKQFDWTADRPLVRGSHPNCLGGRTWVSFWHQTCPGSLSLMLKFGPPECRCSQTMHSWVCFECPPGRCTHTREATSLFVFKEQWAVDHLIRLWLVYIQQICQVLQKYA